MNALALSSTLERRRIMHWGSLPKLLHEEVLLELSETRLVSLGIIRLGIPRVIPGETCTGEDKA